jgi:putative flippase GtrA
MTVTDVIIHTIDRLRLPTSVRRLYLKNTNFWNYGLVCGVGVLVNQVVLHLCVRLLPLWLSDLLAILSAWLWNYSNSVGRLSKYWGFS